MKRGAGDEEASIPGNPPLAGPAGSGVDPLHSDYARDLLHAARVRGGADGTVRRIHQQMVRILLLRGSRVRQVGGCLSGLFRIRAVPRVRRARDGVGR